MTRGPRIEKENRGRSQLCKKVLERRPPSHGQQMKEEAKEKKKTNGKTG